MKISDFTIAKNTPIIEAMKKINANSRGIVYIVEERRLAGVLTDGDIRRFILSKGNLEDTVEKICNHSPKYLVRNSGYDEKQYMLENQINSVPIINAQKEILKICFLKEDACLRDSKLGIPVVIMAGGKGSRLYPYTQILPKPLIPIGEKTITEHIMERFEAFGCSHFDMIVNYKKNFIKAYFQDIDSIRDISFIEETEFLGTGGGLRFLKGKYASTFFMTNCDILIEEDYEDILKFHYENRNIITMVCAIKNLTIPYGTIELSGNGDVKKLNEKPSLSFITNTGLYVIEPEFLDEIPQHTVIHITDLIQKCIDMGKRVGVYPIHESNWMDMGQLDELEKMKKHLGVT